MGTIVVALGWQIRFNVCGKLPRRGNHEKNRCISGSWMFDRRDDGAVGVGADGQSLETESGGVGLLRSWRRQNHQDGLFEPAPEGAKDDRRGGTLRQGVAQRCERSYDLRDHYRLGCGWEERARW